MNIDRPTTDIDALRETIDRRLRARDARKFGLAPIAYAELQKWQKDCAGFTMVFGEPGDLEVEIVVE